MTQNNLTIDHIVRVLNELNQKLYADGMETYFTITTNGSAWSVYWENLVLITSEDYFSGENTMEEEIIAALRILQSVIDRTINVSAE